MSFIRSRFSETKAFKRIFRSASGDRVAFPSPFAEQDEPLIDVQYSSLLVMNFSVALFAYLFSDLCVRFFLFSSNFVVIFFSSPCAVGTCSSSFSFFREGAGEIGPLLRGGGPLRLLGGPRAALS